MSYDFECLRAVNVYDCYTKGKDCYQTTKTLEKKVKLGSESKHHCLTKNKYEIQFSKNAIIENVL